MLFAWEVEQAFLRHETVLDVAAVGVASELGEEEVAVLIVAQPGRTPDPRRALRVRLQGPTAFHGASLRRDRGHPAQNRVAPCGEGQGPRARAERGRLGRRCSRLEASSGRGAAVMQERPVPGMDDVEEAALTVHKRRVAWADVDPSGAWHFTAALTYVEEAEIELLRRAGVLDIINSHLPRIYIRADFKRPAYFDDVVIVHLASQPPRPEQRALSVRTDGERHPACGRQHGWCRHTNELGVSQPLPDAVRAALSQREL